MENKDHINDPEMEKEKEAFSKLEVPYSKSKADAWAELQGMVSETKEEPAAETKVVKINWMRWSIAAVLIILVGSGLFMRFYTVSVEVGSAEYSSATLPDGSTVSLSPESSISFQPYWWSFNREVAFSGEAFFEVEKGSKFSVESDQGTTSVLGTSFNIYSREDNYQVYCKTGKVKVERWKSETIILTPGQSAALNKSENLELQANTNEDEIMSWVLDKFIYNTTPLSKVVADLERHYDVKIQLEGENVKNKNYTGLFNRPEKISKALEPICFSLEIEFEQTGENTYILK